MVMLQITNMLPRYAITGLLLTEETNSPIAQNDKVISKQLTNADVMALRLISLYSITTIVCGMMVDSISNEKEAVSHTEHSDSETASFIVSLFGGIILRRAPVP